MEQNSVLGMVCGYYLSRFDNRAYGNLGFSTQQKTHEVLGEILDVPPASIQNWRDEFDPVHDNPRTGWSGREMHPSRKRTVAALSDLIHDELFSLVLAILRKPDGQTSREVAELIEDPEEIGGGNEGSSPRALTGVNAEEVFMQFHESKAEPLPGDLVDRRFHECGFDFRIEGKSRDVVVEVKGIAGEEGGITFTEKEWEKASEFGKAYYLALVRNIDVDPEVEFYQNPAGVFDPKCRRRKIIQVNWSVSASQLRRANPG